MISGLRRYRNINLQSQPGSSGIGQTTQHEVARIRLHDNELLQLTHLKLK